MLRETSVLLLWNGRERYGPSHALQKYYNRHIADQGGARERPIRGRRTWSRRDRFWSKIRHGSWYSRGLVDGFISCDHLVQIMRPLAFTSIRFGEPCKWSDG